MKMIQAIIRPEKSEAVLQSLKEGGFLPATQMAVYGRGKQRGLKSQDVYYDEIPKINLYIAARDEDVAAVTDIIAVSAQTEGGSQGDGKIFILPLLRSVTLSSGKEEL
jgi:nitrogen regulatory protein PII 1